MCMFSHTYSISLFIEEKTMHADPKMVGAGTGAT
jgi:hypothetical protein